MNDKWIIGIDADKTTLLSKENWREVNGEKVVTAHEITLKAIAKMQELGHIILLNTGRGWFGAEKIYRYLDLKNYVSTSAGALILNPNLDNPIVIDSPISKETAMSIANEEVFKDILEQAYFDGFEYCHTYVRIDTPMVETVRVNRRVRIMDDLNLEFNPHNMILSLDTTTENLQEIIKYIDDKYGSEVNVTNYQGNRPGVVALEINNSQSDKGDAILNLAKLIGVDKEHTMAIGDGENDLDMLSKAHIGVALHNAVDSAKDAADVILDKTNDDGAVGIYLNEFFNLGL